jgi:SAM-dependent methyltransferase
MGKSPYDLLDRWISNAEAGRALDLGTGDGEVAIWLDGRGYEVEALEVNQEKFQRLQATTADTGIECVLADLRDFYFETGRYSLVTAFGVLHFLQPTHLWTIADLIVGSLAPGGLFLCEVFTTDDPGFDELKRQGSEMIEPNTFHFYPTKTPIHYFEPNELARVFSELDVLELEEYRRIDPDSAEGFRAGASLVARKVLR